VHFLLDTDTASYLIKGNRLNRAPAFDSADTIAISSITAMELQFGVLLPGAPTKYLTLVARYLDRIDVRPFDDAAANRAALVRSHLQKIGKPSGSYDSLIAGHALALGAVLVTNNTKHFENVPGLQLTNWA
jgi:tRNA(fMet)-specific endonuclease VapC